MQVPPKALRLSRQRLCISTLSAFAFVLLLTSCASPGPPHPPSLHLSEVVTDLTADRVGEGVHLRWTTPQRTTDGLKVPSPLTAEICREISPKPEAAPVKPSRQTLPLQEAPGCSIVLHLTVKSGVTEADDQLPAALTHDPVVLLGYRIRILNPQGRSAGISRAALVPAGEAPPMVMGLKATPTRTGAMVEWQPSNAISVMELDRTLLSVPTAKTSKKAAVALPEEQPIEVKLRAANPDADSVDHGGTMDRTAIRGQQYRYRAQRIRTVEIGGDRFELRGELSAPITLIMTDHFAPAAPTGLAAAPGTEGATATIDLSWQANTETDLVGYNVYRREGSSDVFRRITTTPVVGPGFSDATASVGHTYMYRVTAVDGTGNESSPSNEVTETARKF
ncbi:fibronectin type III domain-containing protein [Edaphobacter albus]|uniref:fibronectin type III domain-containing protein n=1 Tax=Edaphobacter sp. 4G125 TaxID=2763071 RepID=UPI001644E340|nr:fibronectin type III domain-containing protein [Edaphobacter sp. 4G125]QNI36969.1 fibronectin type III domain-containing protein [Edaphobacter sp. 4G125]